jgi:murein L,D-transpeptidase YafK
MLVAALVLAGCETDGTSIPARALKPLSPAVLAELESRNMTKESPIVVRLFKEESELEIWKQDRTGHFALLRTYPICRWSGELGPKTKEGDRQAPEGFYTITQGQMNPNSHYYLSFDIGYPNAFDRAYGRTGSNVMVHGDCSSAGCYAMTDEQIGEIYALAREAFFGGQRSFQVQALPFHMTALNMARHRNNPNMPFWKMLKEGSDHFEVSGLEPKVDVCEKRYVFDAEPDANASMPLHFDPAGRCPAYRIRDDMAAAVHEKQHRDDVEIAQLASRGTPTAPVRTGTDGGTNAAFLATYQPHTVREANGTVHTYVERRAPGLFPWSNPTPEIAAPASVPVAATEAPPARPDGQASDASKPEPPKQVQPAASNQAGGNVVSRMYRHPDAEKPQAGLNPPVTSKPSETRSLAVRARPGTDQKSKPDQQAQAQSVAPADTTGTVLSGAQPVVPAGNFENRGSTTR